MSEISTRTEVTSVESVDSTTSPDFAELLGGLVLIAGAGLATWAESRNRSPLLAPRSLHGEIEARYQAAARGPSTREHVRAAALTSVQGLVATASAAPAVRAALADISTAPTVAGISHARTRLAGALEAQQGHVFTAAITQACVRAAARLSFTSVEVSTGADGGSRVLAKDAAGRALVSEIKATAGGDGSIETEVSGARDPECGKLMSAWDEAIALEGVRSAPTRRRKTGGVAQLPATIAHVLAKAPQRPPASTPPVPAAPTAPELPNSTPSAPAKRRRATAARPQLKTRT